MCIGCSVNIFKFSARQNQRNRSATRKGGGRQNNSRGVTNGASLNLSQTGFNSQASQVILKALVNFLYIYIFIQ